MDEQEIREIIKEIKKGGLTSSICKMNKLKTKITSKKLRKIGACLEAIEYYFDENKTKTEYTLKGIVTHIKKEKRHLDWAIWIITKYMNKKQRVGLAIFSAGLVLKNFEREFPEDLRPRQAIEAARKYFKKQSEENRSAVRSAARSAWSATRPARPAARSAAESAWLAARSAAWPAAWLAARSARSAAESARSAARSARSARSAILIKIINHGIKILEGKK